MPLGHHIVFDDPGLPQAYRRHGVVEELLEATQPLQMFRSLLLVQGSPPSSARKSWGSFVVLTANLFFAAARLVIVIRLVARGPALQEGLSHRLLLGALGEPCFHVAGGEA